MSLPGREGREEGFILPTVLAILVVVAAAAAAASNLIGTRVAVTGSRTTTLRLQGVADGIARMAAVSLLVEHGRRLPGLGLPENGSPVLCPLPEGVEVEIAVQDQGGLIDLNTAPRPLMENAFQALGIADRDAMTIAAEIVDYRDPDDVPEPNGGAEAAQYRARGLSYGPRNGPFGSTDELDLLPSMTDAMAAVLRPAVTVYNPGAGFDPRLAPSSAMARTVLADSLSQYASTSPHWAYEIRVVARDAAGSAAGRVTLLSTGSPTLGTGLLAWRFATATAPAGSIHPACGPIGAALAAG